MKLRLQAKYSLLIQALIIAVVLSLGGILLSQVQKHSVQNMESNVDKMEQQFHAQARSEGAGIVKLLAENLVNPLYHFDFELIDRMSLTVLLQENVVYFYLLDGKGQVLHDGRDGTPLYGLRLKGSIAEKAEKAKDLLIQEQDELLDITQPIFIGEQKLGSLRLGYSLAHINEKIVAHAQQQREALLSQERELLTTVTVTTLILLAVGLLLAAFIASCVSRPIHRLVKSTEQIAQGDFTLDTDWHRHDELGDLHKAFIRMSRNIKDMTAETIHQAYHDDLTGLPNRLYFHEQLQKMIATAKREEHQLALMFIDLDDFKRINDSLGHDAGDELLMEAARRMNRCIRETDYAARNSDENSVARLGGDEFTILLSKVRNSNDTSVAAQRILTALSEPFELSGQEVVIGASIGVSHYPEDGDNAEDMLKHADIAMYEAKNKGKNSVAYYTQGLENAAGRRLYLENAIRHALQQDQFSLVYQPIFECSGNQLVGAEALLRWHHETEGNISPGEFIPVAEASGLILPLGQWVIEQACRDVALWQQASKQSVFVTVNVSGIQLLRQNLAEIVGNALQETRLKPTDIRFEMTETVMLDNLDKVKENMEQLNNLGIELFMDGFGTGYSSLKVLNELPFSGVNIDRSFVRNSFTNTGDLAMCSAIIAMARQLGMKVVAEGVETQEQYLLMQEKFCDYMQGFHTGKPRELDEFIELLQHLQTV